MSDLLISAVARRSCVLFGRRRRKLKKMSPPEKLRLLSFRHSRVMMPMFKVYIIILEVLVPFVVQSSLYSNFFLFVSFSESVS